MCFLSVSLFQARASHLHWSAHPLCACSKRPFSFLQISLQTMPHIPISKALACIKQDPPPYIFGRKKLIAFPKPLCKTLLKSELKRAVPIPQQQHLQGKFKNETTYFIKPKRNPMSQLNSNKSQSQNNLDGGLKNKVLVRRIQNKVTNGASPWLRLIAGLLQRDTCTAAQHWYLFSLSSTCWNTAQTEGC